MRRTSEQDFDGRIAPLVRDGTQLGEASWPFVFGLIAALTYQRLVDRSAGSQT